MRVIQSEHVYIARNPFNRSDVRQCRPFTVAKVAAAALSVYSTCNMQSVVLMQCCGLPTLNQNATCFVWVRVRVRRVRST